MGRWMQCTVKDADHGLGEKAWLGCPSHGFGLGEKVGLGLSGRPAHTTPMDWGISCFGRLLLAPNLSYSSESLRP